MSKYDDLDIFNPEYIYPSEIRGDRPKPVEEKKLPLTREEQRKLHKQQAQERSDRRRINHIRATDSYVQSLEKEIVQSRTYLAVKNLKEDFNEFTNKYKKEPKNEKDDKEKKSQQESKD